MFDLIAGFPRFSNHFEDLVKAFDNSDFFCKEGPHFVDNGDNYKLVVPVDEEFDSNNIKVHLDGDRVLCVDYAFRTSNSTKAFTLKETLPEDSVPETISAEFKDYDVVITVDKKRKKPSSGSIEIPITDTKCRCTRNNHCETDRRKR